jgi:mannose-6-phosphate isomerase-like protein (cupin superfamily)
MGLLGWSEWAEVTHVEIVELRVGETRTFERCARRERLVVVQGACLVEVNGHAARAAAKATCALETPTGSFVVREVTAPATVVRLGGHWGAATGGSGVFTVVPVSEAPERGDPTPYPKHTAIDNHYHDCDEYWIVLEGRGVAATEGRRYEVGPGDCVLTRAGDHHDFPEAYAPVTAVYFETTLVGQGRRGHLWAHTHGPTVAARG